MRDDISFSFATVDVGDMITSNRDWMVSRIIIRMWPSGMACGSTVEGIGGEEEFMGEHSVRGCWSGEIELELECSSNRL